jgi:hypothetical protein
MRNPSSVPLGGWRGWLVGRVVAVFAVIASLAAGAATAGASGPELLSVSVSPYSIPTAGGTILVSARVAGARVCSVDVARFWSGSYHSRLRGASLPCASGRIALRVPAPSNPVGARLWFVTTVTALRGHAIAGSRPAWTTQEGSVSGLDECAAGPRCDYGPIDATYQTYGNTPTTLLGDCSFAAAANWEQIVLGAKPNRSLVGIEYGQAGGTQAGLRQDALWAYWKRHGIAGVTQTGLWSYYIEQLDVENAVRDYRALIVQLRFTEHEGFAQYTLPAGLHDVVVDGFTPEGPLVVSWGETLQMTWAQWRNEAIGMWGIAVR